MTALSPIGFAVATSPSGRDRVRAGILGAPMVPPPAPPMPADLAAQLFAQAKASGDFRVWAEMLSVLNAEWRQAAAAELWKRLAPAPATSAPDTSRKRLARLALATLRTGCTARALLAQLDTANAGLARPLSRQAVGEVAAWAIQAIGRPQHAA